MNRTIARKMIVMSVEFRTLGSIPGATRSESISRSSSRAAIQHLQSSGIDAIVALEAGVKQEARQQVGADRNRADQDVLVRRVRSAAFSAEAVEHGHADGADQVAVRAAAARLACKLEPELAPVLLSLCQQTFCAGRGLERGARPAARELEPGAWVVRLQRGERSFEPLAVLVPRDADVDLSVRFRGDDVLARSAANDADVDGDAALVVVQGVQRQDLVRELLGRADAFGAMRARVGGTAGDRQSEPAEPFPRDLEVAACAGRLDDERGGAALRLALEMRPRLAAAHLLVGGEEDPQGACPAGREPDRLDEDDQTGLHVVHAGPVGAVAVDPEGHRRQRPLRPDGVGVADEHERRLVAVELDDEMVAVEEARAAAERLQCAGADLGDAPDSGRVGGRLDLDELAQEFEQRIVQEVVAALKTSSIVSSAREARTTSASRKSASRVTSLETAAQTMPARLAARTPAGESSNATPRDRRRPEHRARADTDRLC